MSGRKQKGRIAAALLHLFRSKRNGDLTLSVQGAREKKFLIVGTRRNARSFKWLAHACGAS
jgi:hypothetical protein